MASKSETKKVTDNTAVNVTENSVEKQEAASGNVNTDGKRKNEDSVYTVDEFCSNAQSLFHTMPECVRAALKEKGIEACNKAEAENVVKEFMKKEVK
ncbi:MAG: hypothetical protein NC293_07625 [Roseburia sp.]|nr:hypothetical protein [Roseburia sp.]